MRRVGGKERGYRSWREGEMNLLMSFDEEGEEKDSGEGNGT